MSLESLIKHRRTIHKFTKEKVGKDLVLKALELSLWVPNHRLSFPWRYVLAGTLGRAQIADLAVELKSKKGAMSPEKAQELRETLLNPAYYVAFAQSRGADEGLMHEDYATLACSVQTLSLYLWENGVGCKWSTSGFTTNDRTYEILNLDKSKWLLGGGLLIGKPAVVPPPSERPNLNSLLFETP